MRRKLIFILGAWALSAGMAYPVRAQQLFFDKLDIGDGIAAVPLARNYCVGGTNNGLGTSRSFDTGGTGGNPFENSSLIEFERPRASYPGSCLSLCADIVCVSTETFGIDELSFEIFKFGKGANPLNADSTPPIKTTFLYNIGRCVAGGEAQVAVGRFCANWDGNYNLNGLFGKTNGQFGFRAKVSTNKVTANNGNIKIEQTSAYPGQNQIPIQVNVTNIHSVRSTPTVVGKITGVAAQPYNLLYRLSKDAITNITIYDANSAGAMPVVRDILVNTPRVGEGTPDGTLTNGDFWDGRNNNGDLVAGGNYLVSINARSYDMWQPPEDLAFPVTMQLSLDPLQVTDVAVAPLGVSSTDMAVISYMLTEAATVYVDIYPPGTIFTDVNSPWPLIGGADRCDGQADDLCLRSFVEEKESRKTVMTYWDGRDGAGRPVCDGNYVYAVFATLPGAAGAVWTRLVRVGVVPVARGHVVAFMSPSSTVVGSSPAVSNLDPFFFRYTPARDTFVSLNIKQMDGVTVVRNLVANEVRASNFLNREIWDGKDNAGLYVSSGSYLAELITTDPFQCAIQKTAVVTSVIPVHMFRAMEVSATPLMGGTSDMARISFELSQTMYMKLAIYPVSTVVNPSVWPPNVAATPVFATEGIRPGRYMITEYWDGRDVSGRLVEDGRYPFTLVAYATGTAQVMYATDKTYGYVDVSRGKIIFTAFDVTPTVADMFNSSDTVTLPPYEIEYVVSRQAKVTVKILDSYGVVRAKVKDQEVRDGNVIYKDFWDGRDDSDNFVPAGVYNVRVTAEDIDSQLTSMTTVQLSVDVDPLRIYDVSILPLTLENVAEVSYQVSEPMKVVTKIYRPGTSVPVGWQDPPRGLVKRLIGVRPPRTEITEYWDGTDLTLARVPDGNYVFKIYASTVSEAISNLDGSVAGSISVLSPDIITANIPVTRGGVEDLCGEFANETFFAPNPYNGTSGWFRIPIKLNGWASLKMYNIAGDLVYKRNFGDLSNPRGAGADIDGSGRCVTTQTNEACWPRVNSYGRPVAPGVYFAVIRFEATEGTRDICQTVKKILLP